LKQRNCRTNLKEKKQMKAKRVDKTVKESAVTEPIEGTSSTDYSATSESEDEFLPSISFEAELQKSQQMRLKLPTLARTSDRYGLSDRASAAVATAVLQDIGLVTEEDKSHVIDRSKLRRERAKKRKYVVERNSNVLFGLFFDGRKDKTLVSEKKGAKFYRRTYFPNQ
jgi:hypothetical protein